MRDAVRCNGGELTFINGWLPQAWYATAMKNG